MTPYAPSMEYITYIWLNVVVNNSKYSIHGACGDRYDLYTSKGLALVEVLRLNFNEVCAGSSCSCPFCVAGVGRSNYHPAVNLVQ